MAANLRIKVGASLEASALTIFAPLEKAAQRARATIEKELGKPSRRIIAAKQEEAKEAKKAGDSVVKTAKQQADAMVKDVERSAKERVRLEKQAMREIERELKASTKARAREERAAAAGPGGGGRGRGDGTTRFGRQVGYWAMRNFSPVVPTLEMGRRLAGDVARGVGVNTDISSFARSFVERQKMSVDIANSAYIEPTKGKALTAANVKADPRALMEQATKVGMATAYDPKQVLEGLQKFVELTGDLKTGRDVLEDMAKLARATGSNMEDVVAAAGEISSKLPEGEDKVKALNASMRMLAQGGKLGAIEMRDFARELGKIAAVAPMFEGSVSENVGGLGAMMQVARQLGGAKSASQAATSIMTFTDAFSKEARVKEFHRITGSTTMGDRGKFRSPEELILETMMGAERISGKGGIASEAFGMSVQKIAGSAQARRAIRGYEEMYKGAGGGKAGAQAIHESFVKFGGAMSQKAVDEQFATSMDTAEAKVTKVNITLQKTADDVMIKLLPALERFAPAAEKGAKALGDLIIWATEHPGRAIATALTASIAKAALDNVVRAGVERLFSYGAMAGGGGVGGGGGGGGKGFFAGGVAGNVGGLITIAAASFAAVQVGTMMIDKVIDKEAGAKSAAVGAEIAAAGATARFTGAAQYRGAATMTPEQYAEDVKRGEEAKKALQVVLTEREAALRKAKWKKTDVEATFGALGIRGVGGAIVGDEVKQRTADVASAQHELDELNASMAMVRDRLTSGSLNVVIVEDQTTSPPPPKHETGSAGSESPVPGP